MFYDRSLQKFNASIIFTASSRHRSTSHLTATMETRSSSSPEKRRERRGRRPPLPTRAGGKKPGKKKKAPASVAKAAKNQVVEEAGKVYIKPEADFKPGGHFTEEEDIYICKAWVSCTTDPIIGAQQKGEKFYKSVHEKMYILYNEGAEVAIQNQRPWDSIRNRFQKTIAPNVQKFNAYYKQAVEQNESGWTTEMYMETAMKVWERMEGKPFKFSTCTRVLHQVPKFNPMVEDPDEEEEDKKPAAVVNPVGKVMGDTIDRPVGNKKAKKQKLLEKLDMSSVTSSMALDAMARSSAEMTQIMARRQKHDSWSKRAELYMKLGQANKALELLQKMEDDDNKPYVSNKKNDVQEQVPNVVVAPTQFTEGRQKGDSDSDSDDDEAPTNRGEIIKAACFPSLSDSDSDHPSQPTDDSRKVKKVKKTAV